MVVGDRNAGNGIAVELGVGIDREAAAGQKVVVDGDVGDWPELIVDHDCTGRAVRVDDRVVADR